MGPDYQNTSGTRPREVYAARSLLTDRAKFLARISEAREPAKDESLPYAWDIIWPNRIRERREACKIPSAAALANKAGEISYQRLCRLECGTHVARQSELELISRALECDPDDLKLPVLTLSQTSAWKQEWSQLRTCGGDHDAVLLAAYVRHLVEQTGRTRNQIIKLFRENWPIPFNALNKIWFAATTVDRHPDTTMFVIMQLSGISNWEDVIRDSRRLYRKGALALHITDVQAPRVRFAPEDPDARAPWTYAIDPFRQRKERRYHIAAHTAHPGETKAEIRKRERQEQRDTYVFDTREFCRKVIEWSASTPNIERRLTRLFPDDPGGAERLKALADEKYPRIAAARARIVRRAQSRPLHKPTAAAMLGITPERLRQLINLPAHTIAITGCGHAFRKELN